MGICKFCHQKAGWFATAHNACIDKANDGFRSIQECMMNAVVEGKTCQELSAQTEKIIAESAVPRDWTPSALQAGWSDGAELRCKKQPISSAELSAISELYEQAGFKAEDMMKTAGFRAMTLSFVIWSVLQDQIQPYHGPIQFNLQPHEIPVFGIANVHLSEQQTETSYVGGYGGVSIRVASGLYYQLGQVQGHRVQNTSLQELDYGEFLMTTSAVYFGGRAHGLNFRTPYSQIVRFRPYSDGIGICRNGAREQIFAPQEVPDSGWWLFNLLSALAARDSGASEHHA